MTEIIGHRCSKVMLRITGAVIAALLLLSAPPSIHAASTNSEQKTLLADPLQTVVAEQLAAFKARDSKQAYNVISNKFQKKYKSPLSFATMMRLNFWELYNHASYRFLGQSHLGDSEIQKVEVTGYGHEPRVYLFRLTKSDQGAWLIDDVIMLDPEGQPI